MYMYIYELKYDYFMSLHYVGCIYIPVNEGCHCRDRLLVRFTTTCAISDYHHLGCEFEPCSWRSVLNTTL
jgi:hypothetical protein